MCPPCLCLVRSTSLRNRVTSGVSVVAGIWDCREFPRQSVQRGAAPCAWWAKAYLKTSSGPQDRGCLATETAAVPRQRLPVNSHLALPSEGLCLKAFLSNKRVHVIGTQLPLRAPFFLPICYHRHKSVLCLQTFPGGNEVQTKVACVTVNWLLSDHPFSVF